MIQISASFDDGSKDDLRIADLIGDIPCVFFIPVNWRKYNLSKGDEPLTVEDVENLADKFEIGSHGTDHLLLTRIDESEQTREILDSLRYWKNHRIRTRAFCYPRGYYTTEIKRKVEDCGYQWARTVRIGELAPAKDRFETHTTVHVGYDRKEYGTDWLTYAKKKMKEAIKRAYAGENIEYRFWGHSAEISKYDQWDRFKEFLKELDSMK